MNEIVNLENSAGFLRLQRAKSQIYREAERFQIAQLILTVAVPFAAGVVSSFVPDARSYAGALSVFLTLLDISWLDRQQRKKLKIAARISEQFDTGVLDLPWNVFIGRPVEPELIERASNKWRDGEQGLRDWYPANVGKASIALGRILCQRANLRYDGELRNRYGRLLVALAILIVAILIAIAFAKRFTIDVWVLTTAAPAGPILLWAIRELFRQADTGTADDAMRGGVEALWDQTLAGTISADESRARSRTLQDAIFSHRSSSPLIFPFIYGGMRARLEAEMRAAVDRLLHSAGIT